MPLRLTFLGEFSLKGNPELFLLLLAESLFSISLGQISKGIFFFFRFEDDRKQKDEDTVVDQRAR